MYLVLRLYKLVDFNNQDVDVSDDEEEESFGVEKFHVPAILYFPVFSTGFCYVLHAH